MDVLKWVILWPIGMLLGIMLVTQIALPLLHGIPKSVLWAYRGLIRWTMPLAYLGSGLLWVILLFGGVFVAGLVVELLLPGFTEQVAYHPARVLGHTVGIIYATWKVLGPQGRADRYADFADMGARFMTERARQSLEIGEYYGIDKVAAHSLVGSIVLWLWMLGRPTSVVMVGWALFGNGDWWLAAAAWFGASFAKDVGYTLSQYPFPTSERVEEEQELVLAGSPSAV